MQKKYCQINSILKLNGDLITWYPICCFYCMHNDICEYQIIIIEKQVGLFKVWDIVVSMHCSLFNHYSAIIFRVQERFECYQIFINKFAYWECTRKVCDFILACMTKIFTKSKNLGLFLLLFRGHEAKCS